MRKVVIGVGVIWLLIVVAGGLNFAYAQAAAYSASREGATIQLGGSDLALTLGVDVWPNQWVKSFNVFPVGGANVQQQSAFGVGFIPTATLTYQRFFLSASYMATPDYHFGQTSTLTAPFGVSSTVPGVVEGTVRLQALRTSASRQEGDLTVGYFPLNWLGFAVGYKGIFQRFDSDLRDLFTATNLGGGVFKNRFNGLTFGVLTSAKIDDSFSVIGNAFGGYLFHSCSPSSCSTGDSPYTAAKLVVRYAPTPQLSLTIGYRIQIVNLPSRTPDDVVAPPGLPTVNDVPSSVDITHGPILGVNYRF